MNLRTLAKRILPQIMIDIARRSRNRHRLGRIGVRRLAKMHGVVYFGSAYGGYAVPTELVRGSIGLSFGAGEDISFEIGVARKLGVTVHIYDPTPRAVDYCRRAISEYDAKGQEGAIHFYPYGVWSSCKTARFYAPVDPAHVSHSILNMQDTVDYFEAECLSPKAILAALGNASVSFIKLNIEGAEYEVVNAMFNSHITPKVVCITFDELHAPIDEGATERLRTLVRRFYAESYLPVHLVDSKVTFVRSTPIPS